MSPAPALRSWNFLQRIAFRFAFVYLGLYCLPGGIFVSALSPWVATRILHLSGEGVRYHMTGSGDTLLNYVQVLVMAVVAAVAALVWSALDRKRAHYETLHAYLRVLVRFTLALVLMNYGLSKVILLQMPEPSLNTLTETYGESSPMHLLWTFMGASLPYQHFSGMAEVTAGLLLAFRRTTTLGACVAAGVMLNVVVLNFCYDVPVKLYSSHLLLMALFLLAPEVGPLWRFFVLREAAAPHEIRVPVFQKRWMRIVAVVCNVLAVLFVIGGPAVSSAMSSGSFMDRLYSRPPLFGVWSVDSAEKLPFSSLVVSNAAVITARTRGGESAVYAVRSDARKHHWSLASGSTGSYAEFDYTQPDPQHLVLTGTMDGVPVTATLRKKTEPFLLTSRGFHWISEYPFNR